MAGEDCEVVLTAAEKARYERCMRLADPFYRRSPLYRGGAALACRAREGGWSRYDPRRPLLTAEGLDGWHHAWNVFDREGRPPRPEFPGTQTLTVQSHHG